MAEEKKDKKSTEVQVEKRFCTKCGRELSEGEVCNCEEAKPAATSGVNTQAIASYGKGFLDTVLNMYKKPASTVREEVQKKDIKSNMIMLVAISISYALFIMGAFASIIALINGAARADINDYIEIPYLKIFLYVTIIYFLLAFIPIVCTFLSSKIFGGREFDFKKAISLYTTSMAPTVFTNLLMAILYYLDILSWVGALIGCVVGVACFFHYILGFAEATKIQENKKSYAITTALIAWIVIEVIIAVIFIFNLFVSVGKDVYNDTASKYSSSSSSYDSVLDDIFNW